MKNILIFFALVISFSAFSQGREQQYVWAKNGLSMRVAPSLKAKKIKSLPYGTFVTIIQYDLEDSVIIIPAYNRVEEPSGDPYYLHGSWVKACSVADTGYLFSGYLSTMTPFLPALKEEHQYVASIEDWILQHEKILNTRKPSVFDDDYSSVYSNHVIQRLRTGEGGSGSYRFIFPQDMTFQDGFLLLNYFSNLHFEKNDLATCEYLKIDIHQNYLRWESIGLNGGIFWMFLIFFDGEMLVIEEGAGC